MSPVPHRKVVGCMTGTSLDALDVALVAIDGRGLEMHAALVRGHARPLGPLAASLRRLASQEPLSAGAVAQLADALAGLHVAAISDMLCGEAVDLIAVHGQTVFHAPPLSWQLLSPTPIARAFAAPVVFDLRAADLAAGGRGAPITPLADYVLFRDETERRAVVNFGGYCNFTLLPRIGATRDDLGRAVSTIRGGDICACNHLLDGLARVLFREPFDAAGRHAAAGQVRRAPRDDLVEFLRAQAEADRSLGTGDELLGWIDRFHNNYRAEDLARSACDALASVILESIGRVAAETATRVDAYVLAGGGVQNRTLFEAFASQCAGRVCLTDTLGIPAAYREAAGIAVLGALSQDRVPITLPAVTGVPAPAPVAGAWLLPG
jgi:1,6-anhydro-N-acetylmuramate kinase